MKYLQIMSCEKDLIMIKASEPNGGQDAVWQLVNKPIRGFNESLVMACLIDRWLIHPCLPMMLMTPCNHATHYVMKQEELNHRSNDGFMSQMVRPEAKLLISTNASWVYSVAEELRNEFRIDVHVQTVPKEVLDDYN